MRSRSDFRPVLLARTYANLGATYRTLGEDEQAHKSFDESLRFNSNQFNAWLGLGLLAQKQGELDEAISFPLSGTPAYRPRLLRTRAYAGAGRAYP